MTYIKDLLDDVNYIVSKKSFQEQCKYWRAFLEINDFDDANHYIIVDLGRGLCGNAKVSFNYVIGEL